MEPALIPAASRPLVRALSALIRRKDADAHSQTAFVRGLRDTRAWVKDKPLGLTVLCGLPASLVAVLATVLTDESPLWLPLAAAGAGFVVGTLLAVAALLVTQWLAAPVRQRDEARAQFAPASSDELASLVQDRDSVVIAERATRPASPISLFIETGGDGPRRQRPADGRAQERG